MSSRCASFSSNLLANYRKYSSLNRNLPFNFFSISTVAAMASTSTQFPATPYQPKYDTWPYERADFRRYDENDDGVFYRQPRLVTHIDDPSIARLTEYYDAVLPRKGTILDMCTSWKSFYPASIQTAIQNGDLEGYGIGLNAEEMNLNPAFKDAKHWKVLDLNQAPHDVGQGWPGEGKMFDAVTCVVSIDYLVKPLEVCKGIRDSTKEGGMVHLVVSNRCFPNKVVRRWTMLDERGRLELLGDYLHFSGWKNVEIVDLCARDDDGKRITDDRGTVLTPSPRLPDHLDPLWVVCATK